MKILFKKAFIDTTERTSVHLFRYFFVALAAFVVDFSGLVFLKEVFHVHYLIAGTISFICGVLINFMLSTRWIFTNSRLKNKNHEFGAVLLIASAGLALNDLILWLLTSRFGIFYIYSKLFATALIFFWNFFVRRRLLYSGGK